MREENFSTGIHNGWVNGLDPIGSLAGKLAGIKTNGSEGHLIQNGNIVEESFDYNPRSGAYISGRAFGATLGLGLNVLMFGFPQIVELVSNAVNYRKWNRK